MNELKSALDPVDRMTLADALSHLTNDILQRSDCAAMVVGLETRAPFLDMDVGNSPRGYRRT
jgi:asparagine synthase (glutamine-hydrolysing)